MAHSRKTHCVKQVWTIQENEKFRFLTEDEITRLTAYEHGKHILSSKCGTEFKKNEPSKQYGNFENGKITIVVTGLK